MYGKTLYYKGRFTHSIPFPCRAHAVPLPCRVAKGLECLSHLIYTVRPYLIHTYHAMPMPCSDYAVLLKATARPSLDGRAMPWPCEERHGHGMASVKQTRPHCVNQMGKTHSQTLSGTAWQGNGMGAAWERHAMCKSASNGTAFMTPLN
jgi:hypothetical protein